MADKERYDIDTTIYPPGVEQDSNEAYIHSIITAMKTAGIVGAGVSITGEQIAPIIAAVRMGIDTGDATATINDIVKGKTAYAKGEKLTGNIQEAGPGNVDTTFSVNSRGVISHTFSNISNRRIYLDASSSINSSHNLPTVTGTTVTPGTVNQTILTLGKYGVNNNFTVLGSSNLRSEYIKAGITIFNVVGTANTILNTNYNDGITTQYISSSGGRVTIKLRHTTSLNFTPKAAYVYFRDILTPAYGSALISAFIDASGRCILTSKNSSDETINVGSTCTWYGSSVANGDLADIRIDPNLGFGGPYIAAIYG